MKYYIQILLLIQLIFLCNLNASRLWGIIQKDNSPLILDYNNIYKQLLELQLQGNIGNYSDWPYNSDDGWGLVKYSQSTLNPEIDIFNSPIPAINDPEFINSINLILNYYENTRISLGHVRKSTSGAYTIPNPHPFNFYLNNRTYSFAHNGTIDKIGLMNLITENSSDSSWIRENPPSSYECGHWESSGFDCIVDSELYFLWIMKNIIETGDDLRGLLTAINILENSEFTVNQFYGEQRNFVFSNGNELFAYKSADSTTAESRHELYYKSNENHFSIMSSPFSVDSGYVRIENQNLLILSSNNINPIIIKATNQLNPLIDYQILNDIILVNEMDESNCVNCNNNNTLESSELGIQQWENNRLTSLNLSNYSIEEIPILPSSVKLLTNLNSYIGPSSKIIPEIYCNNLPISISLELECNYIGCTAPTACNYNSFANEDDGTCIFSYQNKDCEGNCIFDIDSDGICDEISNVGCTEPSAINYNPNSTIIHNCFYDNILLLKKGNNLVSLPGELENNNTHNLLTQLMNQNLHVNFILGQGVGIFNIDNEWSGNLDNLESNKGYWINTQTNFSWHAPIINQPWTGTECIQYELIDGNNLISYTGNNNLLTINALNGEFFSNNFQFILGQSVGLFNMEDGWTGNLYNLENKKGYWLNSLYPMEFYWGIDCNESTILDSLNKNIYNKKFHVVQSTNQSFYLLKDIIIEDFIPTNEDYVLAYNKGELIGAAKYNRDLTILPVMGKDYSDKTMNFIDSGEYFQLKFYLNKKDKYIDLHGYMPPFKNLAVHEIETIKTLDILKSNNFIIQHAYPNPFNASTNLNFFLDKESKVIIELFDIKGKKIKQVINQNFNTGHHQVIMNSSSISSGIYFVNYQIKSSNNFYSKKQKLILLK